MSGPEYPDAPPPEVPVEFAATYRDAYLRALGSEEPFDPATEAQQPAPTAAPSTAVVERDRRPATPWRTSRWFLPVLAAVTALMLVLAAYVVGRAFSGDDEPAAAQPQVTRTPEPSASTDDPTTSEASTSPGSWDGEVEAVSVDAISADCTAAPSTDAAGRRVTYGPENAIDARAQTAWRCAGTAVGETLTLRIVDGADVAEVGLIPGYAKTDPESGADRYAENNRITRVRWTFGDVSVVQRLDPDPSSRAMQLLRVPRTEADTVTLEILAVARGPRNTTAVSEIAIAAAP